MLPASWTLDTVEKGFRSFNAENVGFVDQRAAKLLAAKVEVLKKKSAALAIAAKVCASPFSLGSSPLRVESFWKFDGQQL